MLSYSSIKASKTASTIPMMPSNSKFSSNYLCSLSNILLGSELCQWLWPKLLRADLAEFMEFRNGVPMRKDNQKPGPSGMSRNEAFSLPEQWGGRNCLLPVDVGAIREIKEAMGRDALLDFTTPEFSARAQDAYYSLYIVQLTLENVWHVFQSLYPLVFIQ